MYHYDFAQQKVVQQYSGQIIGEQYDELAKTQQLLFIKPGLIFNQNEEGVVRVNSKLNCNFTRTFGFAVCRDSSSILYSDHLSKITQ